jgi:hypothetical protein
MFPARITDAMMFPDRHYHLFSKQIPGAMVKSFSDHSFSMGGELVEFVPMEALSNAWSGFGDVERLPTVIQDAKFHRGPSFTSIHSFLILSTNYIRSPLHCKKKRLSDISSNKFSPQRSRIIFNFVFNRKQEQQVSMLAHGQGNCGYEHFFTARYVPSIPPQSSLHFIPRILTSFHLFTIFRLLSPNSLLQPSLVLI